MSYKGVIFDLDGTLLDTLFDIGSSVNRVLASRGFPPHAIDTYRGFVGDGSAELIRRALPAQAKDDRIIRECYEAFLKDYGQNWRMNTRPYRGVPEMLDALVSRKIAMAVLSNKPQPFTDRCVTKLLSRWRFAAALGQQEGLPKKPDPTGALNLAACLGLPPSHVLLVGDSGVDMKTARAASMTAVGALWGFRSEQELRDSGADVLIHSPTELLDLLDS